MTRKISRREFVGSAITTAAIASLPANRLFAGEAQAVPPGSSQPQTAAVSGQTVAWKDQAIENLTKSPHAKLRDIPVHAVTIQSGFWAQRREINVTKSIPTMHDLLEANGRMNNFRRLVGKSSAAQSGPVYSDSDVYKWTEAVGFALQSGDRPELRATAEKMIAEVVAVQEPNGYLNTYYQDDRKSAANAYADPDHRPRTLQHRPHAAGRDRLLPRHRRPHAARRRHSIRR